MLGAGAVALGTIEGTAELTASLLKIGSGIWADRISRRKPLVTAGYITSGFLRPLIGLTTAWHVVLILRIGDRIGKGIRTSPRDAMIADEADEASRGIAYGFQRTLDHLGAVAGPLAAATLLALMPSFPQEKALRFVFLLASIPAIVVVIILTIFVKEKSVYRGSQTKLELIKNWRHLGSGFHRMLLALLIFTLGNSTDAFLLLKLSGAGIKPELVALLWSFHHIMKAGTSTLGGWLSDLVGRRQMQIAGWFYYALIYFAFAFLESPLWLVIIFILYGVYYGLTEPTERAWVADLAPKKLRGEAFGWYHGTIGVTTLPASVLFGALWTMFNPKVAFLTGALLAFIASLILFTVPLHRNADHDSQMTSE